MIDNEMFLEEETRQGYTISREMKAVWAVELDIFKKFIDVCEKYNLEYFIDSGTLIGAVRDGKYIPWDDDIDLVMRRRDYNKLLSVADKEFSHPIFFQTFYSDKDYVRYHAQIRNSNTTGCILADLDKPFNRGIFIDIFILDQLPDSDFLLKLQIKALKIVKHLLFLTQVNVYNKEKPIKTVVKKMVIAVAKGIGAKRLYTLHERICSLWAYKDTERLSYIGYSLGKERHIWKTDWFKNSVDMKFENLMVKAPAGYHERLMTEYGDYMTPSKAPSSHGDTIFSAHVPYTEYLEKYKKDRMG